MVVIRLKSGFEMRVDCEIFTVRTNSVTGEITHAHWDGCKNIRPMFFRLEDVDCIYQTIEEGETEQEDKE